MPSNWSSDHKVKRRKVWDEPPKFDGDGHVQRVPKNLTWAEFITDISEREGSDAAVGRRLGFQDGSRVSEWRRGSDRGPAATTCALIAVIYQYDSLDVLRLGGHGDLADLLSHQLPPALAAVNERKEKMALDELRRFKRMLDEAYGRVEGSER